MDELREPRHPDEFIPLARAAALIHERLFPGHGSKESKTLDMIAVALSAIVPLFQRDMASGALHAVAASDVAAGRFTRGATTLEVPHRAPLRYLVLPREALAQAAAALVGDSVIAARVASTLRQGPRTQSMR
jgi:hypothetical protein